MNAHASDAFHAALSLETELSPIALLGSPYPVLAYARRFTRVITLLLVLGASYAIAAPTVTDNIHNLPALQHEEIHDEFGQYTLRYVTAEGTIVSETGRLVPNPDGNGHVMVVEGEVTYIGDDGNVYTTRYTAGFDGYKPVGEHLPKAPAVPVVANVAL